MYEFSRSPSLLVVFAPVVLFGLGCSQSRIASSPSAHSSGEGHAPKPAYTMPGLSHGLSQSPINIRTHSVTDGAEQHSVHANYQRSKEKVVNKGHTIEVDYDRGSTITFDDEVYDFKQFHFHTPSEHLVDGVTYPMEMHMVHTLRGDDASYLVIGVLFKEGDTSAFLDEFLSHVPTEPNSTEAPDDAFVDINHVFDGDDRYYTYQGSLTTPPYTETVRWGVLKRIHEASPEQIAFLNRLEGDNARHIQAVHGRRVEAQ